MNRASTCLTGVAAALCVAGAQEDLRDGLEVGVVTVAVLPHRQLGLPQHGALLAACCREKTRLNPLGLNRQDLVLEWVDDEWNKLTMYVVE